MLSENMRAVYKRLLVLGLLCACLVVFGLSADTEGVFAANCVQDCENTVNMCDDNCAPQCSDLDDATCNACLASCASTFNSCMAHAVWCENGPVENEATCEVIYSAHCPIINGTPDCNDPGAHNGYALICNTMGGGHCIACPDDAWHCVGDNGYGSCY
jgi:hypothetical protein